MEVIGWARCRWANFQSPFFFSFGDNIWKVYAMRWHTRQAVYYCLDFTHSKDWNFTSQEIEVRPDLVMVRNNWRRLNIASISGWFCESRRRQIQLSVSWWRIVPWRCRPAWTSHYGARATGEYPNHRTSGEVWLLFLWVTLTTNLVFVQAILRCLWVSWACWPSEYVDWIWLKDTPTSMTFPRWTCHTLISHYILWSSWPRRHMAVMRKGSWKMATCAQQMSTVDLLFLDMRSLSKQLTRIVLNRRHPHLRFKSRRVDSTSRCLWWMGVLRDDIVFYSFL